MKFQDFSKQHRNKAHNQMDSIPPPHTHKELRIYTLKETARAYSERYEGPPDPQKAQGLQVGQRMAGNQRLGIWLQGWHLETSV